MSRPDNAPIPGAVRGKCRECGGPVKNRELPRCKACHKRHRAGTKDYTWKSDADEPRETEAPCGKSDHSLRP